MSDVLDSRDAQSSRKPLRGYVNGHIAARLYKRGYEYLDQLAALPTDELRRLLPGDAAFESVMAALDRAADAAAILAKDIAVSDASGREIGRVPKGALRQIAALTGTARALRFDSPADLRAALEAEKRIDPDTGQTVPFGWNDLARYRLETERIAQAQAREQLEENVEAQGLPAEDNFERFENEVKERVAQYTKDYDVEGWVSTDFQTLRQLAFFEMRLEAVQRAQARAFSGSREAETANKVRTEEAERLVSIIVKIKNELQISLKARAERAKSTQADQVITDLSRRGKQLMAERMAIWQHCGVMQFMAFPIFPDGVITGTVRLRCTRCGKEETFALVTSEMLATYTTAGAFIPDDAPPGLFVQG